MVYQCKGFYIFLQIIKVEKRDLFLFDEILSNRKGGFCMWIYENNSDNSARFILGEIGKKTLICIGANPSTAEPGNLDGTTKNTKSISIKKGFDGWVMINLYPQRATDPNDLHKDIDQSLHDKNLSCLGDFFTKNPPIDVWACWGELIIKRQYLKHCFADICNIINSYNPNWLTLGKLPINGHPHHPLYIAHSTPFLEFNISGYQMAL